MQYLKALVIGLGVLIILCVGLLAYGLLTKTGSGKTDGKTDGQSPSEQSAPPFGTVVLEDYPGCRILSALAAGERLVITLTSATPPEIPRCQFIVVVHMTSGEILGTVQIKTE